MNKLKLIDFKAYQNLDDISFGGRNFLLYGDNGAGKSSIYEAIKIIFFKDRLSQLIPRMNTSSEQDAKNQDFWGKYNNRATGNNFQLEINGQNYNSFNSENYQTFMLSLDDLNISDSIYLDKLLKKIYISVDNIDEFCISHSESIETNINISLQSFRENIQIEIDIEDDYAIKIIDTTRNLESKVEIKKYFNEAKINLVLLLLIFESIKKAQDDDKKRVLVLDDFITSLDMSNRTFLMKYILESFEDFQIVIFTHNVYFYNLIMYLVNDIYRQKDKWQYANLYEIGGRHKLYMNAVITKISDIRSELNGDNPNFQTIGNQVRQKFERLLYEFSKSIMVGAVWDSNKILELIENSENIYLKKQGNKSCNELVKELETILDEQDNSNLKTRLQSKINSYKLEDLENIQKILRDLKLYRKVSMHSLSHGRVGQSSWSQKEIEESLVLLQKLEQYISSLNSSEQRRTDGF